MSQSYRVTSFYKFKALSPQELNDLKIQVAEQAHALKLLGLLLLAPEGCNATVAGLGDSIERFKNFILDRLGDLSFKDSFCERRPFKRFKVDVRPEIVTSGFDVPMPPGEQFSYLEPIEWQAMLNDNVVVLDVRNDYEVALGKFRGAIDPKMKAFSEFPKFVAESGIPKDKTVLMYCTGGIRCEKAYLEMRRQGYKSAFQLHGGILRYLEQHPNKDFEGECFVFDYRVALNQELKPSARYSLCPHCGNPGEIRVICTNCSKSCVVCDGCLQLGKCTCSKNCAYHAGSYPL